MASELESNVGTQNTATSSDNPPPVLPEDQPVLYRVSTDVEYTNRYVRDADERLRQLTGGTPEAEQYFALKVQGGYWMAVVVVVTNMFGPNFIFWGTTWNIPA